MLIRTPISSFASRLNQVLAGPLLGKTTNKAIIVLSTIIGLLFSASTQADTSVWRVSSGSNVIYLGGTVHLLRPSDYPLPDEYEDAYQDSDELYFETDITAMTTDLNIQVQMSQRLTYQDERTLRTVLSTEAYDALNEYAMSTGLPLMMLEKMKPGLLISTLQVLEFQKLGFTPQGVDAFFNSRAMGDAKNTGALETIEEQIGFIAAMGEGNESEFVLLSIADLEDTEQMMAQMISAWRSGNARQLQELFVDDMRNQAPEVYDSLLRQRNLKWMPQIDAMLRDNDKEFVLVGAAHLVGEDGLLEMLQARGYDVTQL